MSTPAELLAGLAGTLPDAVPPGRLVLERQRSMADRLAGRPGRAVGLRLSGPDLVLALVETGGTVRAEAIREVRGVAISRRELGVPEWLALLRGQLHALVAQSAADETAIHRALAGLGLHEPDADLVVPESDLAGGLGRLPARLAGRVPDDVVAAVSRIAALLLETLSRLEGPLDGQAWTVRRAACDYLPTTLRRYLALPPEWAAGHDLGRGLTALDALREQLATLEDGVTRLRDAALTADVRALEANGRFLTDRLARSGLDQP